ncbi:MAG TPA: SDR family oxidoreductase [Chloroflexi bacterium]|nr:SDR family oxidoreductase [Chloroflexota bacterium]
MHYLVTGGAGFIGSNIVEALVRREEQVRVLDNFATGKRENLAPWLEQIELIEGDVRDLEAVQRAMAGVDYVLHQAALPSVPRSIADPMETHACNATGTLNVLLAAREAGVKRLVYASSSSVYGDSPTLPKREDMPTDPLSPYAVSKLAGEHYCRAFYQVYGLETVCLRYFNVFGPRQDPTSQYAAVVPKFVTAMLDGRAPTIYGDGMQSRDFTYVTNVVQANLLACRAEGVGGEVFNVACGERFTVLELVAQLERALGKEARPEFAPPRPGEIKHSLADIARASERLGYAPLVGFGEGVERVVAFFTVSPEDRGL